MATQCFNCGIAVQSSLTECPECEAVLDPSGPAPRPAAPDESSLQSILSSHDAAAYIPVFEKHGITPQMLPHLTNDDLKDMGIDSLAKRFELLNKLKGRTTAKASPTKKPKAPPTYSASARLDDWGTGGKLLDMNFSGFVTPRVIRSLYTLSVFCSFVVTGGMLLFSASVFMDNKKDMTGFACIAISLAPFFCYLSILAARIACEAMIVLFRIAGDLRAIRLSKN